MTPVASAIGNAPTNSNPALPQPQSLNSLDFLKILVAEFRNQDPTAPNDPTQFASQMVQFANLGQLERIDKSVQKTSSGELMQAASAFIGREVITPGNTVGVKNGKSTSIAYAPPGTDSYRALVFDANGRQVDDVSLGQFDAGSLQNFTWEPSSSIGDGLYTVKIVDSKNVALGGLLEQGVVQSVALSGSGITLDLGNLVISADAVASIAQP